jgi:uncharacterized membrane protein YfcA
LQDEHGLLLLELVFLALMGVLVGLVASMVGVGGGVFIVPILSVIFDFTSQKAVGTSLAVIIFTSLASTYAYSRQKRIDYKVGLVSAVSTIPGAVLGAYLTNLISSNLLGIVFSVFLILVAVHMAVNMRIPWPKAAKASIRWHRRLVDSDGKVFEYDADILLGSLLAFFGGFSSGLLGIGGGSVMVPILHLVANLPMHVTVATSMFIMIFTSAAGVLTHLQLGNVQLDYSACIAIGVVFGAQFGARIAKKASGKMLKTVFSIVLLLVSVRLLLKFI